MYGLVSVFAEWERSIIRAGHRRSCAGEGDGSNEVGQTTRSASHLAAKGEGDKAEHFEPREFEDRYENAVVEMLKQKQAGIEPKKETPVAAHATVVNLMDALRRSIQVEQPAAKKGKVGRQTGKREAG